MGSLRCCAIGRERLVFSPLAGWIRRHPLMAYAVTSALIMVSGVVALLIGGHGVFCGPPHIIAPAAGPIPVSL